MEIQGAQYNQSIMKKNKTGGITLLKFKCYCKAMVIQIA